MFIATLVVSALLALAFLGAGFGKVTGPEPKVAEMAGHVGFSARSYRGIGALEIAGAAGVLIGLYFAPLGIAAAIGLALLMAGAVIAHIRVKDKFALTAPSAVLGVIAVIALVLRVATI
jgi:uncharacterized membrane protein YphA (DoxX/SURF4 family)